MIGLLDVGTGPHQTLDDVKVGGVEAVSDYVARAADRSGARIRDGVDIGTMSKQDFDDCEAA